MRRSAEIEALFADVDVVAFMATELLHDYDLFPAEAKFIENAIEGRKAEFATGRACARAAITALGVDVSSLPVGEGRQPRWPNGVTAAITHTRREGREFVAAVAALNDGDTLGIGVDAEVVQPLKDGVRDMLLVPSEIAAVEELPADLQDEGAIRVFSAKEAFYKAQYPLTGGWVGFGDMKLDSLNGVGHLHETGMLEVLATVKTPAPFRQLLMDGLVISSVVVRSQLAL